MLTAVTRDLDSRRGRFERCFCRRLFIMMIKAEFTSKWNMWQVRNIIFCENFLWVKRILNFSALKQRARWGLVLKIKSQRRCAFELINHWLLPTTATRDYQLLLPLVLPGKTRISPIAVIFAREFLLRIYSAFFLYSAFFFTRHFIWQLGILFGN